MLKAIGGREGAMNEIVSCIVGIFGVQPSKAMQQPTSIVSAPFNAVGTLHRPPPSNPRVPLEARA
ncbi:MAG: hypothetical protein WAM17_03910 [Rhodoplanes sp.]